MKKWLLMLTLAGFSIASAKTYTITVPDPCVAGQVQLKPGDYKLKLEGSTAVLTSEKTRESLKTPVQLKTADKKFDETEMEIKNISGQSHIEQIRLGGTQTIVAFD